jgi:hypothetical protein
MGNLWIWEKILWELVPCVEVTLMSKFHPIWCLVPQESKLRRKFFGGPDIYPFFWIYPVNTRHIRSNVRHVRRTTSAATFDDYFDCNLLIVCPIDHILLPLAS